MLEKSFCGAPAAVEFLLVAAARLKGSQLLRVHEARGDIAEPAWSHALHIHSYAVVVKGYAQAICRMAEIEGLRCQFRLTVGRISELNLPGGKPGAAGELPAQQRADKRIMPAFCGGCGLFCRRQQLHIDRLAFKR